MTIETRNAIHASDVNATVAVEFSARLNRIARDWRFWALVVTLLAAATAIAYRSTVSESSVEYITAPATRGVVAPSVTASGIVNPVVTVQVGTYVSGVIQELHCDYNTEVKKGQLCAKIDQRPYAVVVEQDKASLATAQAQLGKDQANLTYAKLSYERNLQLVKRGFVSQDVTDASKNAFDQAQAQIDVDQATIQERHAALDAAQVNLDYTNIISPVDGTVVSRNIDVGQTVAASFQTPTLFLIANDLTKMQVDTNVSESDIGGINLGNKASFTVEAFPNRPFSGEVTQVRQAPITVQNVVTYDAVVSVNNPDLLLKPGMTATTRIITAEHDNVLRVPTQALRYAPQGIVTPASDSVSGSAGLAQSAGADVAPAAKAQIWVLRDGKPMNVSISTGLSDELFVEVTGGDLRAGDRVILSEAKPDKHTPAPGQSTPAPLRL